VILGALLSVAVAIVLLVGALLDGGGPPLAALSLAFDALAGTFIALALRSRRNRNRHDDRHDDRPNAIPSGPRSTGPAIGGPRSGPTPAGVLPPGHFPPGASPRA
jgi:hypothetical protein